MVGATVPEAPVHIDGDSFTRENEIGSGTDVFGDPAVEAVAIIAPVEFTSQCEFRLCIPDALGFELVPGRVVQRGRGLCGDPGRVGQFGIPGARTLNAAAWPRGMGTASPIHLTRSLVLGISSLCNSQT